LPLSEVIKTIRSKGLYAVENRKTKLSNKHIHRRNYRSWK